MSANKTIIKNRYLIVFIRVYYRSLVDKSFWTANVEEALKMG